jgi:hypothetical protein
MLELTKKDRLFEWTEKQDKLFQTIKEACINLPVLVPFQSGELLQFKMDASNLGIGLCAKQERDGK